MLKKVVKSLMIEILTKFTLFENLIKLSRGIGYIPPLEKEVKLLVGDTSQPFVLFDIGANIGEYSLVAAKHYSKSMIYSFEPSEFTFGLLSANVRDNKRITPVNIALGAETKEMTLHSNYQGSGMASLYDRNLINTGIKFNHIEIVNMIQLDGWVKTNQVYPDFIKIDAEGSELSILQGALQTLKQVKAVQFEFGGTAIDARVYFKDFWTLFTKLNFTIYRYSPKGLLKISNYTEKEESFEYMNYVAVSDLESKRIKP